jgi:NADPH:quinone reductase-like Zn-dependent oxidoreductase
MRMTNPLSFSQHNHDMAQALWIKQAGHAERRVQKLFPLQEGEALVRTQFSAVSRGTERLVFNGDVDPLDYTRMRAPFQQGEFSFPVKYGYCAVGVIEDGPKERLGERVFCLHPHQDRFIAPLSALNPVPDSIPSPRATLCANMETALNAVWDSGAGPGDRIHVVGGGIVGLLTAYLCSRLIGTDVTLIDLDGKRAKYAKELGFSFLMSSDHQLASLPKGDLVFHASGTGQGLDTCLKLAGDEAMIIEMSWYGAKTVSVHLGQDFHVRRLKLFSSQVGSLALNRRGRWNHARRSQKAMELLKDEKLDILITHRVPFLDLAEDYAGILQGSGKGEGAELTSLVVY